MEQNYLELTSRDVDRVLELCDHQLLYDVSPYGLVRLQAFNGGWRVLYRVRDGHDRDCGPFATWEAAARQFQQLSVQLRQYVAKKEEVRK